MSKNLTYLEKLKDPRWQKIRLQIFERDDWRCPICSDENSTLIVHHKYYLPGKEPWEYPLESLITLCEDCHNTEKEVRPKLEEDLLFIFRKLFLSDDLQEIIAGFYNMYFPEAANIFSSLIPWILSNQEIQKEIVKQYFNEIKRENSND